MSNRFCNLVGTEKIKDEYPKITAGFDAFEAEYDAEKASKTARIDAHVAGTAEKHGTNEIDNDSAVTGATATEALNTLKTQVEGAVLSASNAAIGIYSMNATGVDTITATFGGLTYFTDMKIRLTTAGTNTGAVTFNLNSIAAKSIKVKKKDGTKVALVGGEMPAVADLQYDGTDMLLLNGPVAERSTPVTVTQQIIPLSNAAISGSRLDVKVGGNTEINSIDDGDFSSTTGLATESCSVAVANNTLSITGSGAGSAYDVRRTTIIPCVSGKKVFVRILIRVTNASSTEFSLRYNGSTAGSITAIKTQATPVSNQWYLLSGVFTDGGTHTGTYILYIRTSYADPATANGKVTECKEWMAIDLTSRFLAGSEPVEATCLLRYPQWFDSTKSSYKILVKSIGRNLFDVNSNNDQYSYNTTWSVTGTTITVKTLTAAIGSTYRIFKLTLDPSKTYRLKATSTRTGANGGGINVYDNNVATLLSPSGASTLNPNLTFTPPSDGKVSILLYGKTSGTASDSATFTDIILTEGTGTYAHEPYIETSAIIPVELSKIANTVYDLENANTGKHAQYTAKKTVGSGDVTTMVTTYTNLDYAKVTIPSPTGSNSALITGLLKFTFGGTFDTVVAIGGYSTEAQPGYLWVGFAKGTSLADARTALIGQILYYHIATSIVTERGTNILNAEPGGTLMATPFDYGFDIYNGGFVVNDVNAPIANLTNVYKVSLTTGLPTTPIAISTCTVAAGGLSATSTALANGDPVYFEFEHSNGGPALDVTYSYGLNGVAAVEDLGKQTRDLDKKIEDYIIADLLKENNIKFTPEGGLAVKVTNKTGGVSVKGEVVTVYNDTAIDNAVEKIVVDVPTPTAIIYESGVADGSEMWVVTNGIADVYFIGSATRGHLARGFVTGDAGYVAGQALSEAFPASPFATDKHFYEIGHVIQSRTGAGLARVMLHFN